MASGPEAEKQEATQVVTEVFPLDRFTDWRDVRSHIRPDLSYRKITHFRCPQCSYRTAVSVAALLKTEVCAGCGALLTGTWAGLVCAVEMPVEEVDPPGPETEEPPSAAERQVDEVDPPGEFTHGSTLGAPAGF